MRAAPKIEVADVYRLAKAMPDRTDMPDLLLELSQLARDTGIRFDSISPQPNAPIGSYTVLPISVTFQGNFYNLADFLYRLRSLVSVHAGRLDATGRLFSVDTLDVQREHAQVPADPGDARHRRVRLRNRRAARSRRRPRRPPLPPPDHDRDGPERRVRDRSSLMAKKQLDPLKAKQQKQKKILGRARRGFPGCGRVHGPEALEAAASAAASATRHPGERRESGSGCPHPRRTDLARRSGAGRHDDRRYGLARRGGAHRPGRPARILQPLREQGSVLAAAQRRAELSSSPPSGGSSGGRLRQSGPPGRPRQRSRRRELRSSRSTGRSTRLPRRPTSRSRARPTRRSFRCSTSSR